MVAVSGACITPPSVAAMHTSGHSIGSLPGSTCESTTPRPAPIMSSGASTPPEVPEPSEMTQMMAFTASSVATTPSARWLCSRSPMTS
ncbi:hypothetical protein D9M68_952250 [compost metagenome]